MAKEKEARGMRDEMHVGPDPRKTRHLVPLKELGKFKVADGDPDVRGWDVYTSTGREVGKVDELLVDVDSGEVVMLDIDLRRNDAHTLAPLRATWIDRGAKRVVVDADEVREALDDLPSFRRDQRLSDEELDRFDDRYSKVYGRHHDDDEYRVRHGSDELRFGRRREDADDQRLREQVRNEREADLASDTNRRQRLVERHPVTDEDRYRTRGDDERNVRYRERDEVIVERRPYVEEVVVRRRAADDVVGGTGDRDRDGIQDDRERLS